MFGPAPCWYEHNRTEIQSSIPTCIGRCTLMSVDLERETIAGKIGKYWISDTKKAALKRLSFASFGAEGRTRTGTYFYG